MPTYKLIKDSIQWQFNKSRAKVQVFAGAFGNGKSTGMIIKGLELARSYPGSTGLMARATYPKLNGTLRKDFLNWCPSNWIRKRPTQEENTVYMHNKTEIHFRYVAQKGKNTEDGATTSNLLSASYDWIILDQIEDPEIVYKDFLDLLGRLRGQTPYRSDGDEDATMPNTGPRWFLIGANPARTWFYREVIHPYMLWKEHSIFSDKLLMDETTGKPLIDVFESDIYANKDNLAPDYIAGLEATYKGQMRERYLLGKWAAFEGLVYPAFDLVKHGLTRTQASQYLDNCLARHVKIQVLEGYDFGNVSPSCYMFGFIDDLGRVIILDGFHQSEFNYDLQPDAIRAIRARYSGKLFSERPIRADPAIFRKTVVAKRRTGMTIARLLQDLGVNLTPASNDVLPGIAKVNAYFADKHKVKHIVSGDDPSPMLYIVDDLPWFQDEINSYYWKRNPQGDHYDEPMDRNDHAMDTLKYMLSDLPEPSKIVIPSRLLPPNWMFWQEMEVEDYRVAARARGV